MINHRHHKTRRDIVFGALALALPIGGPSISRAAAPAFPAKPVQLVVPFSAGGATDVFARIVAQRLSERWGKPVIVDNRAGATGAIGAQVVARAPPDGYTLLVGTASTHAVAPAVNPKLPYQLKDFTSVSLIATFPNLLVVNPAVPAKSIAELVSLLKAQPGKLNFASTGIGGSVHLAAELFKMATNTDMVHVPFKGSGPAMTDLLAGRVDLAFDNIPAVLPFVQSGKLRALGVTSLARIAALPDIPAISETVPGFDAPSWIGVFAPSGLPTELTHKIADDLHAVVQTEDFRQRMFDQGAIAAGGTPEEFEQFVRSDTEKWRRVVQAAGVVPVE